MRLDVDLEMIVIFELFITKQAFVSHTFVVKFDVFLQFAVGIVPFRAFGTFKLVLVEVHVINVQPQTVFVQAHLVAVIALAGEFP